MKMVIPTFPVKEEKFLREKILIAGMGLSVILALSFGPRTSRAIPSSPSRNIVFLQSLEGKPMPCGSYLFPVENPIHEVSFRENFTTLGCTSLWKSL